MFGFMAAVAAAAAPFVQWAVNEGQRTQEEKLQRNFARREDERQANENDQIMADYGSERGRLAKSMYDQTMQQQMTLARSGGTAASQAASQNQALNMAPSIVNNANLAATEGAMGYASMMGQNRLGQGNLSLNKQQFDWQQGEHSLDRRERALATMFGAMGGGISSLGSMMGGSGGAAGAGAGAGAAGMMSDARTKEFNRGVGYKWPAGNMVASDERVKDAAQDLAQAQSDYTERTGKPAYPAPSQEITLGPQEITSDPNDQDAGHLMNYMIAKNLQLHNEGKPYENPSFITPDNMRKAVRWGEENLRKDPNGYSGVWNEPGRLASGSKPISALDAMLAYGEASRQNRALASGPSGPPETGPQAGGTPIDPGSFYQPHGMPGPAKYSDADLPTYPRPSFAGPRQDMSVVPDEPYVPGRNMIPSQKDPWGDELPPYKWKGPGQIRDAANSLPSDHPYFTHPGGGLNPPVRNPVVYPTQADLVDEAGAFIPRYRHIPEHERRQMAEEQELYSSKINFSPGVFGAGKFGYDSGKVDPNSQGARARAAREHGYDAYGYQPPGQRTGGGFFGGLKNWAQDVAGFWGKDKSFYGESGRKLSEAERYNRMNGDYENSLTSQQRPWVDPKSPVPSTSFDKLPLIFRPTENSPGYYKAPDGRIESVFDRPSAPKQPPAQQPAQTPTTMDEAKGYMELLNPPAQPAPNNETGSQRGRELEKQMENAPNPSTPYDEVPDVPEGGKDKGSFFRVRRPMQEGYASYRSVDGAAKNDIGRPVYTGPRDDTGQPIDLSLDISPQFGPIDMVEPNDAAAKAKAPEQNVNVKGQLPVVVAEEEKEPDPNDKNRDDQLEALRGYAKQQAKADEESAEAAADFREGRNISATERLKRMRAQRHGQGQWPAASFNWQQSDEGSKNKGAGSPGAAAEAFRNTPGYAYTYKDEFLGNPGTKPGPQYGIMAQDLEKSPAGSTVVSEDETGMKYVDTERLSSLNSAAIHDVLKRLDKLEGRRRGGTGQRSGRS